MADARTLMVGWFVVLLALVATNAFLISPMLTTVQGSTAVNTASEPCIITTGGSVLDVLTGFLALIPPFNIVFRILGLFQEEVHCLLQFSFFGVELALLGAMASILLLGALVLVGGFVTSGSSRGGIASIGFALIVGGAAVSGLLLIKPVFDAIPHVGGPLLAMFAGAGAILLTMAGVELLSGG